MMVVIYAAATALALVAFLVLRNIRRRRKQNIDGDLNADMEDGIPSWKRSWSPWEDGKEIKEAVKRMFMFWGGALAGITSAAITHQLDVMKTLRQVGQPLPTTIGAYFVGMPMGSFAQGLRFAVTLLLNSTMQKKLDQWEKKFSGAWTVALVSFVFSMMASGMGEFLANPPVVIKNYQIANNLGIVAACINLYEMGGIFRFFNGVAMGVLRKSLANAIVLQAMTPTKKLLKSLFPGYLGSSDSGQKAALGFVAGSLTGAIAEVLTNHPDQVKTMTQAGIPFMEALVEATKHPFRGALWAGIRKGAIRGINWGCLEFFVSVFEGAYRRWRSMTVVTTNQRRISDFTRQTTPM